MEPPTPQLLAALRDLRLAGPLDLRRAARQCRRIARDLPAFDSVWIDALARCGRLTAFQADELHEGRADGLRVGLYVLVDRLSRGSSTFLARPFEGGPPCAIKVLQIPPERRSGVVERLRHVTEHTRNLRSRHVVGPREVFFTDDSLVVVSPLAAGVSLRSRLIHQGRLPARAVVEVACQLLAGLDEAHQLGLPHGDVRVTNVRVGHRGEVMLVDLGVRSAVTPVLSIHDPRPPEWYEGTAPERIGSSAAASPASDVYALGCLLWHLLAGRPPFPFGDPLAMLAAHRARPLPEVRDFAPDAPQELVRTIREMTALDPAQRPTDLAEVRRRLRPTRSAGRRSLRRMSSAAGERAAFPWPLAAATLLALSGLCVHFADRDAVGTLLATGAGLGRFASRSERLAEEAQEHLYSSLPAPDERGVLQLEHAGPYAAADIAFRGPLVIRGSADRPAVVIVTDRPLHLWADEVTLEHVNIVHRPSSEFAAGVPALALVESQNLTIRGCRFEAPSRPMSERAGSPAGVAWRSLDLADPTSGRISVADCVARGVRETLYLAEPPRRVSATNHLAVGSRTLISLAEVSAAPVEIALDQITLRDAYAVVGVAAGTQDGSVRTTAEDCVLDLASDGVLFATPVAAASCKLRWEGTGVVTTGPVVAATSVVGGGGPDLSLIEIEGVTPAIVAFAGPAEGSDAASVASVSGVPRRAGSSLGIDLSRLPRDDR